MEPTGTAPSPYRFRPANSIGDIPVDSSRTTAGGATTLEVTLPKSLADTLGSFKWVVGNSCIGEQPEEASDIAPDTGLFATGAATPTPNPTTALTLSFDRTQTVRESRDFVLIKATCSAPCTAVKGSGKVKAGSETIGKLSKATKAVDGAPEKLKLKLPSEVLTKQAAAPTTGKKKVTAAFKVAALDAGGNVLKTQTGTVKLRRKFHS